MQDPIHQRVIRKPTGLKTPWEKRQVVHAMLKNGLSTRVVGRAVGLSTGTVSRIGRDSDVLPNVAENLKRNIHLRFYEKSHDALDALTPEDIAERSNPYQKILIAKIALDAARMAEGLPSQTIQVKTTAVHLRGELEQARKLLGEFRGALRGSGVDLQSPPPTEEVRTTAREDRK